MITNSSIKMHYLFHCLFLFLVLKKQYFHHSLLNIHQIYPSFQMCSVLSPPYIRSRFGTEVEYQTLDQRVWGSTPGPSSFIFYSLTMKIDENSWNNWWISIKNLKNFHQMNFRNLTKFDEILSFLMKFQHIFEYKASNWNEFTPENDKLETQFLQCSFLAVWSFNYCDVPTAGLIRHDVTTMY